MTLKIKLIIAAIIILVTIVTVISVFVYINHLNNKITDLSVTIEEQDSKIYSLTCQIDSLEKNIESFRETINITNDYISNLERIHDEETATKQEVFQAVVSDPVAKEWFDEEIPVSLLSALIDDDGMCKNDN